MNNSVYSMAKQFKRKFPMTVSWRLKAHSKIIEKYLNDDECVQFVFAAQKGEAITDFFSTNVVALTNKRILLGTKRLFFGHFYTAITPDMFNDLEVSMGLFWGKISIDTVKEVVIMSKIDRNALDEIETAITEYMMEEKKKYGQQLKSK